MFFPRTERLDLTPERIHGLRISLNAPVVGLAGIPTGPSRASILVHDEADGRPQVTIGIRSLRSGDVVVFSFEGEFGDELPLEVGIDAALSFAESMGFLFDDDEVQGRGEGARERASGLWVELMGMSSAEAASPAAELFDHADLSDLRPDDSFQLDERGQGSPAPGPAQAGARAGAAEPEIELAIPPQTASATPFDAREDAGEEEGAELPAGARTLFDAHPVAPEGGLQEETAWPAAHTPLALSLHGEATQDDEIELDLEDSGPAIDLHSAAHAREPVIDLATEAVELGPMPGAAQAHLAVPPEDSSPSERLPALALDSFDPGEALQGPAAAEQAPAPGVGLLTKFRSAAGLDGMPEGSGAASDPGAAAREAEEKAALSRTALGRVRLVKRRAATGEGSPRLQPVVRLLTSF